MSAANTVRELYDLFDAARVDEAAARLDPDIDWDTSEAPTGGRLRGVEAALVDFRGMLEAWEAYEQVVEDVHEADGAVLVVVRNRGRGRAGSVPIEARRAHVWRVRDGRPVSFRLYLDPADAFAALGLSEPR